MRAAVLFSGGKDSTLAVSWVLKQGYEVVLVTVRPPEYSMMFHHPNVHHTEMQAEAMALEQVFVETTEDNWKEKLKEAIKGIKAEGIVTGALASRYQKDRIDALGKELGIPVHSPLWHKDEQEMRELLEPLEIYVTAVSAEGLGPEFLGESLQKLLDADVPGIHPFLEGGEGETFVADAPFFKKRIIIKKWKKSWDGVRGVAEIEEAELVTKV